MNDKELFSTKASLTHVDFNAKREPGKQSAIKEQKLMTLEDFISAISKRDKERVCEKCKYMDRVIFLCQNDYILNNSNTVIEFMNVKQTKNFGCNQFEARAK